MANVFDSYAGVAHGTAGATNMLATNSGAHIYSLKAHKNLDNGSIVAVGTFVGNQVFNSKDYVAGDVPFVVLTPALNYNTALKKYSEERYFYNAAGEVMRALQLSVMDTYQISEDLVNGAVTEGESYLVWNATTGKYDVQAEAPVTGIVLRADSKIVYQNENAYYVTCLAILGA